NSSSGRLAASGIPGEPPPDPTSTTGPSPRSAVAARAPCRSVSFASTSFRIAVRPGVARSAASQRSRRSSDRTNDDEPVGLVALARRLDVFALLQVHVDDLPLDG